MKRLWWVIVSAVLLCTSGPLWAQTPPRGLPEVGGLEIMDTPDDAGRSLIVTWPTQQLPKGEWFYRIEVAASPDGPWVRAARFAADRMWTSHYPEVFGRHTADTTHAFKLTNAPAPKTLCDELETKAKAKLAAVNQQLDDIAQAINNQQTPYRAYVKQRMTLEGRIKALHGNDTADTRQTRLELTDRLDELKGGERHFTTLYEQQLALLDHQTRLKNWTPPTGQALIPGETYHLRVRLETERLHGAWALISGVPEGNWINTNRLNNLVIALVLAGLILFYTQRARKNPEQIFVRRIAGLEAVDEAIGRATEMGKPIFFVHGLAAISTISTVAAINILGKIAEKVAEYGTEFKVTNRDPVVLAVSQETVKEAYLRSGRPDLYNEDHVFYVSQDQFSYATGVEGMFMREKPASNFFFGYYYAEALLLTETGSHIGAIQIAGTDSYTQLPFFITTCDYTLMGEELYAASAYMSREPKLLASLKAQDITKGAIILFALLGVIMSTLGIPWLLDLVDPF